MSLWDKLDSRLAQAYARYLRAPQSGEDAAKEGATTRISVSLNYTGALDTVEALGFRTSSVSAFGRAGGTIELRDVAQLTESTNVLKLAIGDLHRPLLDKSVPEIRADVVQGFDSNSKKYTGCAGRGVIVGIIDSGIDVTHPFFLKRPQDLVDPAKSETRILRIWDQGLVPTNPDPTNPDELPPPVELLKDDPQLPSPLTAYGVEYTYEQVNVALQNPKGDAVVRHVDADGHGTHVASIAAGHGETGIDRIYVGVAPEADLVIVKLSDENNDHAPRERFQHAVNYILNFANTRHSSVVINYSRGNSSGPHDGLTDSEDFLFETLKLGAGRAFVVSSGNDGGKRLHGLFTLQAGTTTTEIPLTCYNPRALQAILDENGQWIVSETQDALSVDVYYPANVLTIEETSLKVPPSADLPNLVRVIEGPNKDEDIVSDGPYFMSLQNDDLALRTRGTVERRRLSITIEPDETGSHRETTYILTIKVTATTPTNVHVWCGQNEAEEFGLKLGDNLPAAVVDDRYLINEPAGADNVIAAGAYNAEADDHSDPVADFSSAGPLADYLSPIQRTASKPDITAPGVAIDAAKSNKARRLIPWLELDPVAQMQGTSMAAPHITGVVALMLEKQATLTAVQIIAALKGRLSAGEDGQLLGKGRIDAKTTMDAL